MQQLIKNQTQPWISKFARLSKNLDIGPGCCIYQKAVLEKNVVLGKGAQVGIGARVLEGTKVPSGAIIAPFQKVGRDYDWSAHTKWNLTAVSVN